jgi:Protein of unknown function (DUF3667)
MYRLECKNCDFTITNKNYKHCPMCGQLTSVDRLDFNSFMDDFVDAFTHIKSNRLVYTISQMVQRPGKTILDYIHGGRKKYQLPVSYFIIGVTVYKLFVELIFRPHNWYIGQAANLDLYHLSGLIFGISLIGWFFAGVPKFNKYNIFESFVVFLFTYGTSFFIAIFFTFAQIPLLKYIRLLESPYDVFLSDILSIIFIFYILSNFFKVADIGWNRFFITAVVGSAYYYLIEKFML